MKKNVDIKQLFLSMQTEMLTRLNRIRTSVPHPGSKGAGTESAWLDWFNNYLPKRYSVDQAFIIDSNGAISDQIDLVVYDQQYSPFVFHDSGIKYIPAESVYAIFEIKQSLNKEHILYAAAKAESVRKLHRTSAPIVHAGGTYKPKPCFDIMAGIITTSSDWNPPLGEKFEQAIQSLERKQQLDIGCSLNDAAFLIEQDTCSIITSSHDETLIFFFLKLLAQLQSLGTVPAMNIDAYGSALDSI